MDQLSRREMLGGLVAGLCGGLLSPQSMGDPPAKPPTPTFLRPPQWPGCLGKSYYYDPGFGRVTTFTYQCKGLVTPLTTDN